MPARKRISDNESAVLSSVQGAAHRSYIEAIRSHAGHILGRPIAN